MKSDALTKKRLIELAEKYKTVEPKDVYKFLYQSTFGCGHMVSDTDAAVRYIKEEAKSAQPKAESAPEELDGDFCRVHLSVLDTGLSPETLGRLFYLSARERTGDTEFFERRLSIAEELAANEVFPFTAAKFKEAVAKYKKEGFPSVSHSPLYKERYKPAYRVIAKRFAPFIPLFSRLDRELPRGKVTLAIEGGSGSGKSTLGEILHELYGACVLHMDDFFLRPEMRTPERLSEVGGNVDRERFLLEVLTPLSCGEPIDYRRFDCTTGTLLPPERITQGRLTVVEGAYSMHPELAGFYSLSVFLDIDPALQRERITARNGKLTERFFTEWIPLEVRYFSATDIKSRCDLVINVDYGIF